MTKKTQTNCGSEIFAQRTAALREAVAQRPDIAFIAVVHASVAFTFYFGNRISCLDITERTVYLSSHAAGIDESPQGRACSDRKAELAKALPETCKTCGRRCWGPRRSS